MRDTSSSCSSPTRSRNVIDLFHQPKLYSTDRSPSPVTLTSPWRLNRRRAKRPLYPRSVNDPVRPRTAVLRLSDENLTGSRFRHSIFSTVIINLQTYLNIKYINLENFNIICFGQLYSLITSNLYHVVSYHLTKC